MCLVAGEKELNFFMDHPPQHFETRKPFNEKNPIGYTNRIFFVLSLK